MKKLNVAIVGLSFGLEFVPIYLEHPDVESLTLVETNVNLLRTVQERYGIPDENCFTDLQQVLDNPNICRIVSVNSLPLVFATPG